VRPEALTCHTYQHYMTVRCGRQNIQVRQYDMMNIWLEISALMMKTQNKKLSYGRDSARCVKRSLIKVTAGHLTNASRAKTNQFKPIKVSTVNTCAAINQCRWENVMRNENMNI